MAGLSLGFGLGLANDGGLGPAVNLFANANNMLAASWTIINGIKSGTAITGPGGENNGIPIEVTVTGAFAGRIVQAAVGLGASAPGYVYFDAKEGTTDFARITFTATGGKAFRAGFNLATGVVQGSNISAGITGAEHGMIDLGDGWRRCWLRGFPGGLDNWAESFIHASNDNSNTANAGNMIYVARAQCGPGLSIRNFIAT